MRKMRRIGEVIEANGPIEAGWLKCRCGRKICPLYDNAPNEMRDMDNELGRDE
jgi:hypothetical protein